jgi:hypothetical protein
VVIDALRCAKLALDRGIGGPLLGPSAYFMKSPPVQYTDAEAHDAVETFANAEIGGIHQPPPTHTIGGFHQPPPTHTIHQPPPAHTISLDSPVDVRAS